MEDLIKKLRDYSRFLELEDSIPYWENQIPELKDRLEEMKWNQQQKEIELLNLEEPNFFQRTFGRAEEKKERISKQIREITAAKTSAQWELEGLEKQIKEGKEDYSEYVFDAVDRAAKEIVDGKVYIKINGQYSVTPESELEKEIREVQEANKE